jgi:hypothetical protein
LHRNAIADHHGAVPAVAPLGAAARDLLHSHKKMQYNPKCGFSDVRVATGDAMRLLFGGLIAVILLCLYEYCVYEAIMMVTCVAKTGCTQFKPDDFTPGFAHAMNLIGGLVSALVIAELAITEPGKSPVAHAVGVAAPGWEASWTLTIVTSLYLLVWVVTGLAAYVVGTMWWPGKLQPLTDLGQGWLGLAVAAAYAYFGISPSGGTGGQGGGHG